MRQEMKIDDLTFDQLGEVFEIINRGRRTTTTTYRLRLHFVAVNWGRAGRPRLWLIDEKLHVEGFRPLTSAMESDTVLS